MQDILYMKWDSWTEFWWRCFVGGVSDGGGGGGGGGGEGGFCGGGGDCDCGGGCDGGRGRCSAAVN